MSDNQTTRSPEPTVLRCLSGAVISAGIAFAAYSLTAAIAQTFANKPIHSDNFTVINIAAAVRTLVVGIMALATGIFGIVAIGLIALAIQLSVQKLKNKGSREQGAGSRDAN